VAEELAPAAPLNLIEQTALLWMSCRGNLAPRSRWNSSAAYEVRIRQPFRGEALPDPIAITGADTSATTTDETGGTKSILRLIRSTAASNPETAALRAEVEGLRLALSHCSGGVARRTLRQRTLAGRGEAATPTTGGTEQEPKIINVAAPEAPQTAEAPAIAPALETEPEKARAPK